MPINFPDIAAHNNPDLAFVDSTFVRGGTRAVANLTALYALSSKVDQLAERITRVWVASEAKYYVLTNIASVGSAGGWTVESNVSTLQQVTDNGSTTTNSITAANLYSNGLVVATGAIFSNVGFHSNLNGNVRYSFDNNDLVLRAGTSTSNEYMRVFGADGNVAIGTSNNNGYKLDVFGTSRAHSLTISSATSPVNNLSLSIVGNSYHRITGGYGLEYIDFGGPAGNQISINSNELYLNTGTILTNAGAQLRSGGVNGFTFNANSLFQQGDTRYGFTFTAGYTAAIASGTSNLSLVRLNPNISTSVGTINGTMIDLQPVINASGGTTVLRGIYYNPTLTSTTGVTNIAFESTSGIVKISDLAGSGTRMVVADANGVLSTQAIPSGGGVTSVFGRSGVVTAQSGDYNTSQVTESGNLYYTDTRARAALSAGTGISYNSTTGVISYSGTVYTDSSIRGLFSAGAGISYNSTTGAISSTITQYTDANARAAISLTTTGSSGAATYSSSTGVLNIPQYQAALTNPVTGTGTTNYLPKFTGTSAIGNSQVFDNGTNVGIGTTSPSRLLHLSSTGDTYLRVDGQGFESLFGSDANGTVINQTGLTGISLRTANSDRMRITAGGRILMGTTSDNGTDRLQVSGSANFSSSVTASSFSGAGTGLTGTASSLSIGGNAATATTATNWAGSSALGSYAYRSSGLAELSGATFTGAISGTSASFSGTITGDGNAVFRLSASNILNVGSDQNMYGGSNSDGGVFVYGANKLHLSTNSSRRLTIDGSGNVTVNGGSFTVGSTSGAGIGSLFAGAATFSSSVSAANGSFNGIQLGTDNTYGDPYRVVGFGSRNDGGNRIFAGQDGTTSMFFAAATGHGFIFRPNGGTTGTFVIASNGAATFSSSIATSGNIAVNSTLSGWQSFAALQVGTVGSFAANDFGGGNKQVFLGNNVYYDAGGFKYTTTGSAAMYRTLSNSHVFSVASSGTAGNVISFTDALTIASTGAATFSSSVTANLFIGEFYSSTLHAGINFPSGNTFAVRTGNQDNRLVISSTGAATFSSSVTASSFSATGNGNLGVFTTTGNSVGYGLIAQGTSGGARDIFIAGQIGFSNGFTVQYDGTIMRYAFLNGNIGIGTLSSTNASIPLSLNATGTNIGTQILFTNSYATAYCGISADTRGDVTFQVDGTGSGSDKGIKLNTNGNNTRLYVTNGGEVYIAGLADQGAYNLQVNGTGVWAAGAYVNGSDQRLKENIQDIDKGLEYINKVRPVKFNYKRDYSRDRNVHTGFIAQQLQSVFANEDYLGGMVQEGAHLNVAYQNLIPIMVKAIQEQQIEIENLKAQLK